MLRRAVIAACGLALAAPAAADAAFKGSCPKPFTEVASPADLLQKFPKYQPLAAVVPEVFAALDADGDGLCIKLGPDSNSRLTRENLGISGFVVNDLRK